MDPPSRVKLAVGVRSPAETKDFSSSLYVQTGSGDHPASYSVGTEGLFRGKERSGRDADHSSPSSTEVENEYEIFFLSPECLHGV
jgi:hypothetical protein